MNQELCDISWFVTEDYEAFKNEISVNDTFQVLTDLLFSNWPEEEIFPESLDKVVEELFVELMFTMKAFVADFQPCPQYHCIDCW